MMGVRDRFLRWWFTPLRKYIAGINAENNAYIIKEKQKYYNSLKPKRFIVIPKATMNPKLTNCKTYMYDPITQKVWEV